jgi:hypothetical protein
MAIQLDIQESNYGVPFLGAYFRITSAIINRQGTTNSRHIVIIDVSGYIVKPENENTTTVDFKRYLIPVGQVESCEGTTFLEKCYKWVMAQPDMVNSIAV